MQRGRQNSARQQRGQWSLVGILVSLTIIMILSAWYYAKILRPQAGSHNGRPASEQKAYGAVCSEYQSQMTQAVAMYKADHNERSPTSLAQLKPYGVTDDLIKAEGCQFQLDAATGTITEIGHGQAAPNSEPVVINSTPAARTSTAPGPYWQQSAPPASAGGQPGPATGPGGVRLPPTSTLPADGGGGE